MLTLMPSFISQISQAGFFLQVSFLCVFHLVLSPLFLGVGFGFSLASFGSCLRLILFVLNCFIESLEPSKTRLGMFFCLSLD